MLDVNAAVTDYNVILQALVDKHVPAKTSTITIKSSAPWYNSDIRRAKIARRRAERKWRASRSVDDFELYKNACTKVSRALFSAKRNFFLNKLSEVQSQKEVFQVAKTLMNTKADKALPAYHSPGALAQKFSDFFTDKIK